MSDNELILGELKKISAWADMQRKLMKYSFIFLGASIPILIICSVLAERQVATSITSVQRPDWYEVDQNIRLGDFDKAIKLGEELTLKTPQYPEAHRRLAGAYLAAGKIEKAQKEYVELFRLFPSEENEKLLAAIDKRIKAEAAKP